MSGPPFLTTHERAAVDKALRAAGWTPLDSDPDVWWEPGTPDDVRLDLREVFPTPFTVQEPCAVIDADEFEAAQRDPATHSFLTAAEEYVKGGDTACTCRSLRDPDPGATRYYDDDCPVHGEAA